MSPRLSNPFFRPNRAIVCAAAMAVTALSSLPAHGGTINFDGRDWNTNDTDPGSDPSYAASGYTGSMTGQFAQDAVMTTALTLNVGDTITYDTALSGGGWFSDTGFGFIDNTGLYDSAHTAQRGGKVQRFNTSTWEFYAYDPTNTQQAYWSLPNNDGANVRYAWTFDSATHVQLTMSVGANPSVTTGWNISNIADVKAFRAGLWDSQRTLSITNFKQRPGVLPASGTTRTWDGTTGDYNNAVNWTGDAAPTLADDAKIDNGGVATVSTSAANSGRAVNLDVSNGTLNVQAGGELFAANIVRIGGGAATGTVNQTGGLVSVDINGGADLRIGFDAGATGNYNLGGGELWVADSLAVGQNGTGTMTVSGGAVRETGFFTVGNNPGANGTFNMTGGSVQMRFGDFEVGDEAVGVVDISGGTFSTAAGWWFSIGNRALGTGTATIRGTAVVNAGSMIIGRSATNTSTLNVQGGTTNIADDWFVGLEGPGQMNMTGGTINVADDFVVGHKTTGTATISGGTVAQVGWIVIGDETSGTGTLNVTGGTINQSFGDLEVGDAGNGTYTQSAGNVNFAGNVYVAKQPGSVGNATVSGGTLAAQAIVNNGAFNHTGGTVNVGSVTGTGATTVGSAASLAVNQVRQTSLQVDGTLTVNPEGGASGTTIVNSLSVAGKLDLKDNDLIVNYSGASPEGAIRQRVKDGRVTGSTSGMFSTPGSPDDDKVLAVADNTAWGKSQFNGFNIDTDTVVGKYTYFGDANLDGKVTGDDYVSVDANLGTGDSWLEGDFNMNGVTTGDDYVAIDANLGKGTPNPLAFAELKAEMVSLHAERFGEGYLQLLSIAEAEGFGATVVPEPGSLALAGLTGAALLGRRRRQRPL